MRRKEGALKAAAEGRTAKSIAHICGVKAALCEISVWRHPHSSAHRWHRVRRSLQLFCAARRTTRMSRLRWPGGMRKA